MKIIGIHDGHNSSACLIINGKVQFAIQEERLRKVKNYWGIPELAIQNCLDSQNLTIDDIDYFAIASHDQYLLAGQNIPREQYMSSMRRALAGQFTFRERLSLLKMKIGRFFATSSSENSHQYRTMLYQQLLGDSVEKKLVYIEHHLAHYATAAFGSGYWGNRDFLIFTNDGRGDGLCATVHLVNQQGVSTELARIDDQHSIANLYGVITACLGFNIWEDEYKIMGMAPYAKSDKAEAIGKQFLSFFEWRGHDWCMKPDIKRIMDRDERQLKKRINKIFSFARFDNICGGIQYAFEKIIAQWIDNYVKAYNVDTVALAGGAFMNVKANLVISQLPSVKNLFVFPSCGDETISIGAAMLQHFKVTHQPPAPIEQIYYGNAYKDEMADIIATLVTDPSIEVMKPEDMEYACAELLAKNEIIARVSGRSEFGARALGNRSILANPADMSNINIINNMIKKRDFWMPFACSILDAHAPRYLENPKNIDSPYMIMAFPCKETVLDIQAGTHPRDKTVRPQIVTKQLNPKYYRLITFFHEMTKIGGLLNTSFNLHGFPLVESPQDALNVFMQSGLKFLALEDYLICKKSPLLQ